MHRIRIKVWVHNGCISYHAFHAYMNAVVTFVARGLHQIICVSDSAFGYTVGALANMYMHSKLTEMR
jgi:hypothetical protein